MNLLKTLSLFFLITLPSFALYMTLPIEHQSTSLWKRADMITADGTVCVDSSVDAPGGMLL